MKSKRPFTYVIDYGGHSGHMDDPQRLIESVSSAPPELLHLAHDVPFPNTYGPIERTDDEKLRRLSGAEAADRSARIAKMLRGLRRAGVKTIIPYICNQTVAGNPDKRLGVWDVYDHWDEYANMGIGPRPKADPMEWLARESNGRPHFNYEMRHAAFVPLDVHRWAPCCNNPHYHEWQRVVVSQIARVGYDGVFVDNCILNCYCSYCQKKFRKYLAPRYTPAELERRFGAGDVKKLALAHRGSRLAWVKEEPTFREFLRETFSDEELVRWLGTRDLEAAHLEEWGNGLLWGRAHDYQRWMERRYSAGQLERLFGAPDLSAWGLRDEKDRLLWAETKRFWAQSICENLQFIKQVGRQERGGDDFVVLPNWGEMENLDSAEFREEIGHDIAVWGPGMDIMMYEEGNQAGMLAPGLYLDHLLHHKYALAQDVVGAVLPGGRQHAGTVDLLNAQAVAGGGVYIQPGAGHPEVRARYNDFFRKHERLLTGAEPYADVAVACLMDEVHLENPTHLEWVFRVTRYLADQHVLFEIVTEKQMSAEGLAPWRALILSAARYLSDDQVAAVRAFARRGGCVVMMGDVGTHDDCARRRQQPALKRLLSGGEEKSGILASPDGRHLFADTPDPLIGPYRVSREEGLQFANYSEASINVPTGKVGVVFELDRMIGIDRYDAPRQLIPRLEKALSRRLRLAEGPEAQGVRFTAYWTEADGAPILLLHVLNYNVPLLEHPRGKTGEPVENLTVSLPLPEKWGAARVELLLPGGDGESVAATVRRGEVSFTIPRLDVYALAMIRRPS